MITWREVVFRERGFDLMSIKREWDILISLVFQVIILN